MSDQPLVFWTPSTIQIEAFTTFGLNAKPNTNNPIGFFGTGLKYAVAVILRHGGTFRLFIGETEYEFYVSKKTFRGKSFDSLRMRRRHGLGRWLSSKALPFTTELGKNWKPWMAYRELMSNTIDEGGQVQLHSESHWPGGTKIEVVCDGFNDEDMISGNEVFLNVKGTEVFNNAQLTIYDAPSKYLYYRGVRVYDLRFPARFTYDFKQGYVELSEDRSARNAYALMYYISKAWMNKVTDQKLLYKALNRPKKENEPDWFEGHDVTFDADDYDASYAFREVAKKLSMRGFAGSSAFGYHSSFMAKVAHAATKGISVEMSKDEWNEIIRWADNALEENSDSSDALDKLKEAVGYEEPQDDPEDQPEEANVPRNESGDPIPF